MSYFYRPHPKDGEGTAFHRSESVHKGERVPGSLISGPRSFPSGGGHPWCLVPVPFWGRGTLSWSWLGGGGVGRVPQSGLMTMFVDRYLLEN